MITRENARFRGPKESEKYILWKEEMKANLETLEQSMSSLQALTWTTKKEWFEGTTDDGTSLQETVHEIGRQTKKIKINKKQAHKMIVSVTPRLKDGPYWISIPASAYSVYNEYVHLDWPHELEGLLLIEHTEKTQRLGEFPEGIQSMQLELKKSASRIEKLKSRCLQYELSY